MRGAIFFALFVIACREEQRLPMVDVAPRPPSSRPENCPDDYVRCPEWDGRRPPRVANPRVVHRVEPQLSSEVKRRGITGDVILRVGIRRDGSVGGVCVLKPLPCGLSDAAIDAVRQWRFEPQGGDVVADVTVHFAPSTTF